MSERVAEAVREGKFICVRLIDLNKGTKEVPKVRSRLVGHESARGQRREYAAAHYLLSTCPSRGKQGPGNQLILLMHIRKAPQW